MISIILLAAGNSRRFGKENKLLYVPGTDGRSMFEHTLETACQVREICRQNIRDIIVVSQYDEVEAICQKKSQLMAEKTGASGVMQDVKSSVPDRIIGTRSKVLKMYNDIVYIFNSHSEKGISESIYLGIQHADKEDSLLFMVCDQPYLKADSVIRLVNAYISSGKRLAALSTADGEPCNPCIFAPEYREKLMALEGDRGGKRIIKSDIKDVVLCQAGTQKELQDIDVK